MSRLNNLQMDLWGARSSGNRDAPSALGAARQRQKQYEGKNLACVATVRARAVLRRQLEARTRGGKPTITLPDAQRFQRVAGDSLSPAPASSCIYFTACDWLTL